uniref:Galactose-specific lectin nattectin-like n=1 Tax=Poecilia reticulata TaxID=8081 RepID=A0A3P9N3W2_POERE
MSKCPNAQSFFSLSPESEDTVVISVSLCSQGPIPNSPACPPGWTQLGSRCFIFYFTPRIWSDAEAFCISIGGNLASIHNNEENDFLSEMITRDTGNPSITWVGGHDAITEGQWMWSDGSKFDYSSFALGQPDNFAQSENCLEINYSGNKWNDRVCNQPWPFICAKKV